MAQLSYPFETQDTTESQYSQLFNELQDTGVAGGLVPSTTLGINPGTGMSFTLIPGFALVRGFAYENTENLTLTCDPSTSQPRIDTVILRLDPSANSIVAAIKKGTPDASPVPPALTQVPGAVWEMPLYDILLPANSTAIDYNNVTNRRQFLGSQVGYWTTEGRPANPDRVRFGFNTTTQKFEYYTLPSGWSSNIPFDVSFANGSIPDAALATPPGRYVSVTNQGATSFTVSAAAGGTLINCTANAAVTVTANTGMATGQRIDFIQGGTGQVTFQAGAGVTLLSPGGKLKTKEQYSAASIVCIGANNYRLLGDLVA